MCGRGHEEHNKGRRRRARRHCHLRARRNCHRQVDSALGRGGTKKTLRGLSRPVMARQASWRPWTARLPGSRPLRAQDSASRSTAQMTPQSGLGSSACSATPTLFFLPAAMSDRPCTSGSRVEPAGHGAAPAAPSRAGLGMAAWAPCRRRGRKKLGRPRRAA